VLPFGWTKRGIDALFDTPPDYEELAGMRAYLQERLGLDEIDLLALNTTHSPITRFEAVSGRAVFGIWENAPISCR
jgi:hypothetical protein